MPPDEDVDGAPTAADEPPLLPPPPLAEGDTAPELNNGSTQLADGPAARAALSRCRVTLLTGEAQRAFLTAPQLSGALHAVTVSTAHAKLLSLGLERLAARDALLAVESADFVVALKQAQAHAFKEHAAGLAAAAGWRHVQLPPDAAQPLGHALFTRVAAR